MNNSADVVVTKMEVKFPSINFPKRNEVIDLIRTNSFKDDVVIAKSDRTPFFEMFVGTSKPENKFGRVQTINGEKPSEDFAKTIMTAYTVKNFELNDNEDACTCVLEVVNSIGSVGTANDSEIEAAWKEKEDNGTLDPEFVGPDFKETCMWIFKNWKTPQKTILRTIKQLKPYYDLDGKRMKISKPNTLYVNPDPTMKECIYDQVYPVEVLKLALNRCPDILLGEKSVGKNCCSKTVCYVMGMPYYMVSPDPDMLKSDWFGDRIIDDNAQKHLTKEGAAAYVKFESDKNSCTSEELKLASDYQYWKDYCSVMNFLFSDTDFKKWIKTGGMIMINERNLGRPAIMAAILNPIAEEREIEIPGEGLQRINEDCVLIASENEGYEGTLQQNKATDSRFAAIDFPFPPTITDQLKMMVESTCGENALSDIYYQKTNELYRFLRKQVKRRGDDALSIRSYGRALCNVVRDEGDSTLHSQLIANTDKLCLKGEDRETLRQDILNIIDNL